MPGESGPTIGQQMETGDQRGLAIWFSASSHRECLAAHFLSRHAGFRGSRFQRFDRQDGGRVLVVDTAWTDDQTAQILNWIK